MKLVLAIAIVAAIAVPAPAEACTCGAFEQPTAESCRGATRVFAGTVARYRWPTAYDHALSRRSRSLVEVELAIDRVWKGDVGTSLVASTGLGGGDCGIHPLPGTRFVVCDDRPAGAPPDFALCSSPAFDASALEAVLGSARAPSPWLWRARPAWWREPLLVPFVLVAAFALLGASVRGEPVTNPPLRYRVLVFAVVACAAAVVALRAIAHVLELPMLAGFGPVALGAIAGAVVGYQGQRRSRRFAGRFGGLAAAVAFAALPITLGYTRLHLPWDQSDTVACSRRRAEAILSRDEPLADALAREPNACTDWGLARYRIVEDRCLGFADGNGSEWFVCRSDVPGDAVFTSIGAETPW